LITDTELILTLIDNGADVNAIIRNKENSPLFRVIQRNSEDVFDVLLEKGVDIHAHGTKKQHSISILHLAAYWKRSGMVLKLIERGLDIEEKDYFVACM